MIPKKTRILVVDDIAAMRSLTISFLRSLELGNVHGVANGQEAWKILQTYPVDVILSDWNMPIVNGIELLRAVRANPKTYKIPFLMITAEADRTRITEAISAGVSGMMIKPYKPAQLQERILQAMRAPAPTTPILPKTSKTNEQPEAEQTTPTPSADTTNRATLLIVDDMPDNLQLMSALFKDDYRIRVANNGARALEICYSDNPPDLVLLDIMMPEMDGFEVARRMREHPGSETIPVIFVTALTDDDARMRGLSLGAIDFVTKPINPDILKPRVKNLLRYISLHKQLQSNYDTTVALSRLRDNVDQLIRHDLKGPLAGIVGIAQGLLSVAEKQAPQLVEELRLIESTSKQVIDMVTLSSDLFKIEAGNFTLIPQNVAIVDLLTQVVKTQQASFESKEISITTTLKPTDSASPQAIGDPVLYFSIFSNLIKNAFEATPSGGQIDVTLSVESPFRLSISNQGIVPAEIRERFFEKYVTSGKSDGTGIGTYSAKRLLEALNGSIDMTTSDEDNTTTLLLTFPKAGN